LKAIRETPVVKKKLIHTGYQEKLHRIKDAAAKALLPLVIPTKIDDGYEILEQKYHASSDSSQKVTILTKAGVYI